MRAGSNPFASSNMVRLKGNDWLEKQRIAGRITAEILHKLKGYVEDKTFHSMAALNEVAERYITDAGGTPTFKGYKGFPAGVCISINKQLVHGIPGDTVLNDGDVVSFDLGVTYQGAIADSALTCIFGTPKSDKHVALVQDTEEALMRGIGAVAVGKRIGSIGHTIYKFGKGKGYGIINNYGGHGLDWDSPHAPPFVANRAEPEEGIRIQPGLAIAIEPMLVLGGSTTTRTSQDGWTVMTDEIGAHFEHSIFVHEDHVEILTDRSKL